MNAREEKRAAKAEAGGSGSADADYDPAEYDELMKSTMERYESQLGTLRSGAPGPALLDSVDVVVDGAKTSLSSLAQVSMKSPKLMLVTPYDPSYMDPIDRALTTSDLNLFPVPDKQKVQIQVPLPKTSKETRVATVGKAKLMFEDAKKRIASVRQAGRNDLKKRGKSISKDDARRHEKDLQALTDASNKRASSLFEAKSKEIMSME